MQNTGFDGIIKVLVGPQGSTTASTLHTAFATKSSDFFVAALKKEWKEGQGRVVRLPEANKKAFSLYTQWLYTDSVRFADLAGVD